MRQPPANATASKGEDGGSGFNRPQQQKQQQPSAPSVIAACISRFRNAPAKPRGERQPPVSKQDFWWLNNHQQQAQQQQIGVGGGSDAMDAEVYPDPDPLAAPMPPGVSSLGGFGSVEMNERGEEGPSGGDSGSSRSSSLDARAEELLAVRLSDGLEGILQMSNSASPSQTVTDHGSTQSPAIRNASPSWRGEATRHPCSPPPRGSQQGEGRRPAPRRPLGQARTRCWRRRCGCRGSAPTRPCAACACAWGSKGSSSGSSWGMVGDLLLW